MNETYLTLDDLKAGIGFLLSGHTCIYQHGDEQVFLTADKSEVPANGWHLAGGGCLLASGEPKIEWCDLR